MKKPKLKSYASRFLAGALTLVMLLTLTPTAFAAEGTGDGGPHFDGDNQEGVAGSDSNKDNTWGGQGAWRVYIATADESGTIKYDPVDVSNSAFPWENDPTVYAGMMEKIHSRNAASFAPAKYKPVDNASIPPLGASQAALKEYWEASDYSTFRTLCAKEGIGWSADEIIPKLQSGEYTIVMEPVAWFIWDSNKMALSATECAILNSAMGGKLKGRMGSLTHNALPGYAWFDQTGKWGIPTGTSFNPDGMSFWLTDDIIRSTYGIARVESIGGMCCPHDPTACGCYKNNTPPNTDPPKAPADCKCFKTHLKDFDFSLKRLAVHKPNCFKRKKGTQPQLAVSPYC